MAEISTKSKSFVLIWLVLVSGYITAQKAFVPTGNPPVLFHETFDSQQDFDKWTVQNLNGGKTWVWFNNAATYLLDPDLPGDDWIFSPAISLKADSVYELSFSANCYSRPENFKVALCSMAASEGVVRVLADYPSFRSGQNGIKKLKLAVSSSGEYHLGWYVYSDPEMHRIEIDNVVVTAQGLRTSPDSVTNMSLKADSKGALADTIRFNIPAKDRWGDPLTSVAVANIYRNNESAPVKIFQNPAIGSALEWVDTNPAAGFNSYYIYCENEFGQGALDSARVFVGEDIPSATKTVKAALDKELNVRLEWEPVTSGVNGGYLDIHKLQYKIKRNGELVAVQNFNSYVDSLPVANGQEIVSYQIIPYSGIGDGDEQASNQLIVGIPYEAPYAESFSNSDFQGYTWLSQTLRGESEWMVVSEDEEYEVSPVDGDGGMIKCDIGYANINDSARLASPILDIRNLANPQLSFYIYHNQSPWYDPEYDGEQNDHVQVQISEDGKSFVNLDNALFFNCKDRNGWTKCEVNLFGISAQFIQLGFVAVAGNGGIDLQIDDISLSDSPINYDLKADSLTTAKRIDVNTTHQVTTMVVNRGRYLASGYSVSLLKDGEVYATKSGSDVLPGQKAYYEFDLTTSVADLAQGEKHTLQAIVTGYPEDQHLENDSTGVFNFSMRTPEFPVATGLTANQTGASVQLEWENAVSISAQEPGAVVSVTDDFESYEPYTIDNIGNWTLVDRDNDFTLVSPRMPDYPNKGERMAFQVFNNEELVESDEVFASHSGNQYLIAPACDNKTNDDWLISPRLDGRQQTFSFWAKAPSYDSERFVVYYSTTDTNPDSFIKVSEGDCVFVHEMWQQYSYDLPAGARYFAIRCVSPRIIMLFIDDITYNAYTGAQDAYTVLGYNVYKNGVKVTKNPVSSNSFIDNSFAPNDSYNVTVVYDEGESAFSNTATIGNGTGVWQSQSSVDVYAENRYIFVRSAVGKDISVYSVEGIVEHRSIGTSFLTKILVSPGVHIVKINNKVTKLLVQ
jgi:hypothetical protein